MEKIEEVKAKKSKLGQILKDLIRSRSMGSLRRSQGVSSASMSKSKSCKSWPGDEDKVCRKKRAVAPEGCFFVYVGPEKERFMIKMEYINHPLFKMLLDEAEMEYGYINNGPLVLPCNVDIFHKILCEMDGDDIPQGCNFARKSSSYQLLSPARAIMHR